jgi:hypothetical protein
VSLDSTTWAVLALLLTASGAAYTYVAWRRHGAAAGVRGMAWTLVPVAAWMTGTLRLAGDVVDAVTGWAAHLVFDPLTWLGIVLAGVSVVLFGTSATMRRRGIGTREGTPRAERKQVEAPKRERAAKGERLVDDDVTAILKKHGIT